jgi:hypothetical protein
MRINKTYPVILETAMHVFNCCVEELKMDELKELETYLKEAQKKYRAIAKKVSY